MDMEIVFFGVGIGMVISTILVGLGVEIADKRHHKRELSNTDSDDDLLHVRSGDRSGNNRRNTPHTLEEKVMALNTFRVGATWFEKCVLDEISDDLIELDAIKYVKEHEEDFEDKLFCPMGFNPYQE